MILPALLCGRELLRAYSGIPDFVLSDFSLYKSAEIGHFDSNNTVSEDIFLDPATKDIFLDPATEDIILDLATKENYDQLF